MDTERRDTPGLTDQTGASVPGDEPEEDDTEGHSLLHAELHRTTAASRAREVAEWGRSERARRLTQEAKKRAPK